MSFVGLVVMMLGVGGAAGIGGGGLEACSRALLPSCGSEAFLDRRRANRPLCLLFIDWTADGGAWSAVRMEEESVSRAGECGP